MCNMAIRILWSKRWVEGWWGSARGGYEGGEKDTMKVPSLRIFCAETLPHPVTLAFAAGTWAVILQYSSTSGIWIRNMIGMRTSGGFIDTLLDVAVIGVMGVPMLASIIWSEWDTFVGPVIRKVFGLAGLRIGYGKVEKEKKSN